MPVIKSAKKRMVQAKKRTERNQEIKIAFKAKIKEVKKGVGVLDAKKMQAKLSEAYSEIDKAAKKNVIHKNNAARKKARLTKLVNEGKVAKTVKKATKKKPVAKKK